MSSLQKINSFPSFHPRFVIQNKRHKRRGTFFEKGWGEGGGGNSLNRTYIEGGRVYAERTETSKGGGGVKNWKFQANLFFE